MTEENNEHNGNNEITLNSILLTAREIFQTVLKNILLWLLDEEHKTLATGVEEQSLGKYCSNFCVNTSILGQFQQPVNNIQIHTTALIMIRNSDFSVLYILCSVSINFIGHPLRIIDYNM